MTEPASTDTRAVTAGGRHAVAIGLILLFEQLPRRHADDARRNAFLLQRLVGFGAKRNFAAGADQDHRRFAAFGIGHDIGAASNAGGRGVARAVEGRERLAGQYEAGRLMLQPDDDTPSLDDLVGVGRP